MIKIKMKIMPWLIGYGSFDNRRKSEIAAILDKSYVIPVCYPEDNIIGYVDPDGDIYLLNGFLYASVVIPSHVYYKLNNPKDLDYDGVDLREDGSGKLERILRVICGSKS